MIRLDRTVVLDAAPDAAFSYVAEFANVGDWDPGVESSEKLDDGPPGVGTRYKVVARFMGVPTPMTYRVVRWEPGVCVELAGETPTVDALDRISFAPEGDGTRVRYEAEFTFRKPLGLAEPLLRRVFERIGDKAMGGLVQAQIPAA